MSAPFLRGHRVSASGSRRLSLSSTAEPPCLPAPGGLGAPSAEPQSPRPHRPRRHARVGIVLGVVVAVAGLGAWVAGRGRPDGVAGTAPSRAASTVIPNVEPSYPYTLLDGKVDGLAALRGHPTLLWFVAPGCSSCQASIPVMASHLSAFAAARTRVLALGLYGAFDNGGPGLDELASFGRTYAKSAFPDPAWTWALASLHLTTAYDPEGVPDEYFLLDPAGRVAYTGATPVSTIGVLLAHLYSRTGTRPQGSSSSPTSAPSGTLP